MAIKTFSDRAAYVAAGLPTQESRVALVEDGNEVKIDGVNVQTDRPTTGDAVYHDGTNVVFYKGGDQLNVSILPVGLTKVGVVVDVIDGHALVIDGNDGSTPPSLKYADVVQFELNAPTLDGAEHTSSIGVRVSTGYSSATTISYTYTATTLAEVVTALNSAIEAKKTELGFTNTLWAYLADDNNNKVTEGATKIIVQFDEWSNYQQYNCSGMTHITWGDMPSRNVLWRNKMVSGNTGGVNFVKCKSYYSSNGATPTEDVSIASNDLVNLTAFNESEYCALLRDTYGNYDNYIRANMVKFPQKYGVFGLPDGKTLTKKYGVATAPTKDGSTKYKFPALHYGLTVGYAGVNNIAVGDWYLPGVWDGIRFMNEETRQVVNSTAVKMGCVQISISVSRWFAQRYNVNGAWLFSGHSGSLSATNGVASAVRCQAVTLLKVKS